MVTAVGRDHTARGGNIQPQFAPLCHLHRDRNPANWTFLEQLFQGVAGWQGLDYAGLLHTHTHTPKITIACSRMILKGLLDTRCCEGTYRDVDKAKLKTGTLGEGLSHLHLADTTGNSLCHCISQ